VEGKIALKLKAATSIKVAAKDRNTDFVFFFVLVSFIRGCQEKLEFLVKPDHRDQL